MARQTEHVLQLRASDALIEQLDRATKALETSRSEYARRAIHEALLRDEPPLARFAA
jgi:hypothetical protein